MPPRRGSYGGGYGDRGLSPTAVVYHRYAVLCFATAMAVGYHPRLCYATLTGFCIIISFTVGYAHVVRFTHGCVISPRRGSVLFHRHAVHLVITRFLGLSPTVVFSSPRWGFSIARQPL